jgi:pimeloyl-ACP methyl ester carboxylesterase
VQYNSTTTISATPLPAGIKEQYIETDDLTYHVLEAGYNASRRKPLFLLLYGFLSSPSHMLPLTDKFHIIAYVQRGYGRTTGWDTRSFSEIELCNFTSSKLITDAVRSVYALEYKEVERVIGLDFGSLAASLCGLMRGDIFKR